MSSFYKSTAGFRNVMRENLGFRGVKVVYSKLLRAHL
jgi:hypothetical protein